jgi:hypothetical protein
VIISASRRTDIPAFYAGWFMNRIRAGFCHVPNPFNPQQVSEVGLRAEDVDVIVFWTRNPRPIMRYLSELDERGYRYYFQYSLLGYSSEIDKKSPPLEAALETFRLLADQIGPQKVIWRYDPIFFTRQTDTAYHLSQYLRIASGLKNHTHRSVISIADAYSKNKKRLEGLGGLGYQLFTADEQLAAIATLIPQLVQAAAENNLEIVSCAEELDLVQFGVQVGKCIDADYIERIFEIPVNLKKDPSQRKACGCVLSKDIGMYDTCPFGCAYCYATSNFDRSQQRQAGHNPQGSMLITLPPKVK